MGILLGLVYWFASIALSNIYTRERLCFIGTLEDEALLLLNDFY
jgi:hypothetical protein